MTEGSPQGEPTGHALMAVRHKLLRRAVTYCRVRLRAPRREAPPGHGTSSPSLRNLVRYAGQGDRPVRNEAGDGSGPELGRRFLDRKFLESPWSVLPVVVLAMVLLSIGVTRDYRLKHEDNNAFHAAFARNHLECGSRGHQGARRLRQPDQRTGDVLRPPSAGLRSRAGRGVQGHWQRPAVGCPRGRDRRHPPHTGPAVAAGSPRGRAWGRAGGRGRFCDPSAGSVLRPDGQPRGAGPAGHRLSGRSLLRHRPRRRLARRNRSGGSGHRRRAVGVGDILRHRRVRGPRRRSRCAGLSSIPPPAARWRC